MSRNDFYLTIEQVGARLNKSTRTIHRYKNSGKLRCVIGSTQGNPLLFSESEVEALSRKLNPHLRQSEGRDLQSIGDRLDRIERVLSRLEDSPFFAAVAHGDHRSAMLAVPLMDGDATESRHRLGQMLIQLGTTLTQ